jgi:hypothetical protein
VATKKSTNRAPVSAAPTAPESDSPRPKARASRAAKAPAPPAPRKTAVRRRASAPTDAATPAPPPAESLPDAAVTITTEDIRVRAYFIALERGAEGGSELEIWLQAERELRAARE